MQCGGLRQERVYDYDNHPCFQVGLAPLGSMTLLNDSNADTVVQQWDSVSAAVNPGWIALHQLTARDDNTYVVIARAIGTWRYLPDRHLHVHAGFRV